MIPLRDDTERDRAPDPRARRSRCSRWRGAFAALVTGAGGWTALLLALNAGAIWIFGAGVEGAVGRLWLLVAIVFGGIGGAAIALGGGRGEGAAAVAAAAATGVALELAAHAPPAPARRDDPEHRARPVVRLVLGGPGRPSGRSSGARSPRS